MRCTFDSWLTFDSLDSKHDSIAVVSQPGLRYSPERWNIPWCDHHFILWLFDYVTNQVKLKQSSISTNKEVKTMTMGTWQICVAKTIISTRSALLCTPRTDSYRFIPAEPEDLITLLWKFYRLALQSAHGNLIFRQLLLIWDSERLQIVLLCEKWCKLLFWSDFPCVVDVIIA